MNASQTIKSSVNKSFSQLKLQKGVLTILIFVLALVAFEGFNYSTTEYALSDIMGDLRFLGLRWSTLLAIAFCGIDSAGIARLFSPQTEQENQRNTWFMFGAWILAGTMNAILTWWGVVMAMQTHSVLSTAVIHSTSASKVVPIFIALMVWVIRILLIGTLSKKSDRLLKKVAEEGKPGMSRRELRQAQSRAAHPVPAGFSKAVSGKRSSRAEPQVFPMQEEGRYHSLKASGKASRSRGM